MSTAIAEAGAKVDILVNSAGFTRRIAHDDLESLDPVFFNEVLLANAGGTYAVMRAVIPFLKASQDAVVINISSVSAFTGAGSNIAYCAAKAAVDTMTQSMARVFGPNIRFLSVSPASVDTEFIAGRGREELESKARKTPLGRVVSADDVARAVLACITHLRTANHPCRNVRALSFRRLICDRSDGLGGYGIHLCDDADFRQNL
jgi:3-oxoacyl-[acyl-carrier protein] reductase